MAMNGQRTTDAKQITREAGGRVRVRFSVQENTEFSAGTKAIGTFGGHPVDLAFVGIHDHGQAIANRYCRRFLRVRTGHKQEKPCHL
jgi:hypothetical protein